MRKIQKILIIFIIMLQMIIINLPIYASVGDFETYDSGSSWSGSSSSSSYDTWRRKRSSSSHNNSLIFGISWGFIFGIFIIFIVIGKKTENNKNESKIDSNKLMDLILDEKYIVNRIIENDENFNKEEFLAWVRDLYVKLQYAWSDRDWEKIRCFETEQLYEQHLSQIQSYIKNHQINKMENVSVNYAKISSFRQEGNKDILDVILRTNQIDYVIDENTGKIIKGDKLYKNRDYKLTFIRKTGVKTKPGEIEVNTRKCPNCGAPTQITSNGKCEYCGSIITTGEFNWVLANLEPYSGI